MRTLLRRRAVALAFAFLAGAAAARADRGSNRGDDGGRPAQRVPEAARSAPPASAPVRMQSSPPPSAPVRAQPSPPPSARREVDNAPRNFGHATAPQVSRPPTPGVARPPQPVTVRPPSVAPGRREVPPRDVVATTPFKPREFTPPVRSVADPRPRGDGGARNRTAPNPTAPHDGTPGDRNPSYAGTRPDSNGGGGNNGNPGSGRNFGSRDHRGGGSGGRDTTAYNRARPDGNRFDGSRDRNRFDGSRDRNRFEPNRRFGDHRREDWRHSPYHRSPNYLPVRVGSRDYFYRGGFFYRHSSFGYCVVRPPRYAVITTLPYFATWFTFGGYEYWRCSDVYYQRCPTGYVVVDSPYAESTPTIADDDYAGAGYLQLSIDDRTYWFKDGQFFTVSPDGLVWVEAPIGAIVPSLPESAVSTWFGDIEYFSCEDVVFRKTPDGYKVVVPPWAEKDEDIRD